MEAMIELHSQAPPQDGGKREDELTVAEVARLWGYGRSNTWHMIKRENVVPYREDRTRIYVRRSDAEEFKATLPTSGRRPALREAGDVQVA